MVPTYKMHGSKARSAAWIESCIPQRSFERWVEPFAGRGNVFFRVASQRRFTAHLLNDLQKAPFLKALRDSPDFEFVDGGEINRELWERWKESPDSPQKWLAESYVARFGSSWETGPSTAGGDSENGHSRRNTILRMEAARGLLRRGPAEISGLDYLEFLQRVEPKEGDLVYLDPPYDSDHNVHYAGIDQDEFLRVCLALPSFVMISGYTSPRYEKALQGWEREVRPRASVGKGVAHKGASGAKPRVEEVLWWRDPLASQDPFSFFTGV